MIQTEQWQGCQCDEVLLSLSVSSSAFVHHSSQFHFSDAINCLDIKIDHLPNNNKLQILLDKQQVKLRLIYTHIINFVQETK